jgi:hypothetical protein
VRHFPRCPPSFPAETEGRDHEWQKLNVYLLSLFTFHEKHQNNQQCHICLNCIRIAISRDPPVGRAQDQEVPGCEIDDRGEIPTVKLDGVGTKGEIAHDFILFLKMQFPEQFRV